MARGSVWSLIIMLLCLSLLLHPALAKGKGNNHHNNNKNKGNNNKKYKKKHLKDLPVTDDLSSPPPPPPPSADVLPPPAADAGSPGKGGKHKGKKKKKPGFESPPGTTPEIAVMPTLSPAVKDLVTKSLGLAAPPSMAPPPSVSANAAPPPAVSPAPAVPGSIDLIVKSSKGNSFIDNICDLAANPTQCTKILAGNDTKYIDSLPAGTTSLLSIELSAAIASKGVLYMSGLMKSDNIDSSKTTCVENYQDAIVGFTGAYANYTLDPTSAKKSMNDADTKIGLCEGSLSSGQPPAFLPQMDDTNKLLRSLIQLVLKEFPSH